MSFEVLLIAQVKGESESGMSDLFGFSNLPVTRSRRNYESHKIRIHPYEKSFSQD
jgi:hypothetical protein